MMMIFNKRYLWNKMLTKYENLLFWIARKLPRKLVYFVIIRVWGYATGSVYTNKHPDEVTWSMVLKLEKEF